MVHKQNNGTAQYTANGQPSRIGQREYVWDALGQLLQVRQQDHTLARYTYSHRGERISKTANGQTSHTLYNEAGQISAELNAQGLLTRQYVYLADQAIAVIDTPQGKALSNNELLTHDSLGLEAKNILNIWWQGMTTRQPERMVWLHANHLGAPQAATGQDGQLLWQARYAAFGAASITATNFTLNLRLPGQYFDAETGLHYNRHRYYDPSRGEYLTPDPLGTPDGPNPYAYVRYNPLKYIDPDGLVLFAFDGTGNTDKRTWLAANNSSFSNVVNFRDLYNDGAARYVSGVGTVHTDTQYGNINAPIGDMGFNFSGVSRIDRMVQYFNDEASTFDDKNVMDVDIIGFSRGAAEARDFSNLITAKTKNGWYAYKDTQGKDQCQQVNFRFMGLWDSVLSTNSGRAYNLAIPSEFSYVAQAIALNEYRGDTFHPYGSIGAFPLESILDGMSSPIPTPGKIRIELGFIGAHADIGGGFGSNENQLSQVALAWMVQQAKDARVTINDPSSAITSNPVLHDKSDSIQTGVPAANAEDRIVRYRGGTTTTQRNMPAGAGMSYLETQIPGMINYLPAKDPARFTSAADGQDFVTGRVDMVAYLKWLGEHGYKLGNLQVQ